MERASASLQKVLGDALRRTPSVQAPLLAWPLTCGTAVAERTRPLDCLKGVLRVEVPDAGWRTELQSLAPQYLAVINRYVSDIRRIEFVISAAKRH